MPGSHPHDDPMPWSEHDPHDDDATRPMPPVSRLPQAPPSGDSADGDSTEHPRGRRDPAGHDPAHDTAQHTAHEDWSWYDDDTQHTRPMPPVTAAPPAAGAPGPSGPEQGADGGFGAGDHGAAGYGTGHHGAAGYGAGGYGTAGFGTAGHAPGADHGPAAAPYGTAAPADPAARLARQRERFGGLQLVPGFYGWLSALALTWLLLALAGLVASALDSRLPEGMGEVVDDLASGSATAWSAAAALGAVEFLAFLGGGYAAGRMARFSGASQGVSVWLWSLLGRSVATVAGLVWADTVGLSPVGISAQELIGEQLVPGLLAVASVLAVDLLGAVLGGLWGLRYHRRVDRWGDTER